MSRRYTSDGPLRVGLAGFGNVGQDLARRLTAGTIPQAKLTAISAKDLEKAAVNAKAFDPAPAIVPVAELPDHADAIVECATGDAFPEIARAALGAGKVLLPVSVGALAAHPEILRLAEASAGTIQVVSGALPGLDAIRAAAEGGITRAKLTSQIRPESLADERYVQERGFDFATPPAEPVKVFEGSAMEAALAFPRHFNVAVSLSLAGIGLEETEIEVWANGQVPGTVHEVEIEGEDARFTMISRNLPSETNRRTSRVVAPSVMAALRSLVSAVRIGS